MWRNSSDKAAASFELYDVNGDGLITYDEMVVLLTSVFRIMYHTSGTSENLPDVTELAEATATTAFQEFDKDHNKVLTKEEFLAWYTDTNDLAKDPIDQSLYNENEKNVINVEEILRLANFRSYDVSEVFECFAERTDENGELTFDSFSRVSRGTLKQ